MKGTSSGQTWKLGDAWDSATRIAEGVLARLRIFPGSPERRTARFLAASDLFDADWYRAKNPDVAKEGVDPALHYLRHGAAEGRDPGPKFSTQKYLKAYDDVAASGINPLLHYLLHGKAEGRHIARSSADVGSDLPEAASLGSGLSAEAPVLFGDPPAYPLPQIARTAWVTHEALAIDRNFLSLELSGVILARLPASAPDSHAARLTIDVFRRLAMAEENTRPREDAAACSVVSFESTTIDDIWYVNDRDVRLRLSSREPCVMRFFQYDLATAGALSLVGESMVEAAEINLARVSLLNAFAPVLLVQTTPQAELISASLLPFPSLCRGGAHYAELCAVGKESAYMDSVRSVSTALLKEWFERAPMATEFAIGRFDVDLGHATGTERILRGEMREWLARVMHVDLMRAQQRSGTLCISLPADAIPSLHALVAAHGTVAPGIAPYVVADRWTSRPRWFISLPPLREGIADLQPRGSVALYPVVGGQVDRAAQQASRFPLAVRFADMGEAEPATLVTPVAPEVEAPLLRRSLDDDTPKIGIILTANPQAPEAFAACLESLKLQPMAAGAEIVVPKTHRSDANSLLRRFFPAQYRFADDWHDVECDLVVLIGANVGMHDRRLLQTLCAIATREDVASVGCALLQASAQKIALHSAGIFMSERSLFSEPDCGRAFPCATYPVAANSSALVVARTQAWRAVGGVNGAPLADIEYGLRAIAKGFHHFCTSVVSAELYDGFRPPYFEQGAPLPFDPDAVRDAAATLTRLEA